MKKLWPFILGAMLLFGAGWLIASANGKAAVAEAKAQAEQDKAALLTGQIKDLGDQLARSEATLAKFQADAKARAKFLDIMREQGRRMARLIDDLLLLSRVSKLSEKRAPVDLSRLIKDVLEELQFSIRERKAEIIVHEHLPNVFAVDTHLRIVFRNLLSNALKFSDKPVPRIEIGASVGQDATTVFVRDNGIGIEPAHFDKIFLIFQRLHRKDEYEGVGAGLTIVKKIIESHGGKIWIESKVGQGSTFTFTIPLV